MNNNIREMLGRLEHIKYTTTLIRRDSPLEAMKIRTDCGIIRVLAEIEAAKGWRLRSDPPARQGQRCLCRYVYDRNPDYPVYMVLSWNECCEVPHFDNEVEGVMRVTHWMEIFEPETGERDHENRFD